MDLNLYRKFNLQMVKSQEFECLLCAEYTEVKEFQI